MFTKLLRFIGLTLLLLSALRAQADIIKPSTKQPSPHQEPEYKYVMKNGSDWYVSARLSPTKTADNRAKFAFYDVPNVANAYYMYNVSAAKWVSYNKSYSYYDQTGFLTLTDNKVEGAYFKFHNYSGDNYQISPYTTYAPAPKYLNWYKGAGNTNNPADGNVSIGLWQDQGAQDAGSRWSFSQVDNVRTYTLSSAGMPASAKNTINGQDYTGVNAQGDTKLSSATLDPSDVSVTCGEGYGYTIIVDNANNQINVDFVQLFTPTLSPTAEKLPPLLPQNVLTFRGLQGRQPSPCYQAQRSQSFPLH